MQKYAAAHSIDILSIPPGAKDKNALAERAIRTFRDMIAKMVKGKKWQVWEQYVPLVERSMRETADPQTGISPFEYLYGFPPDAQSTRSGKTFHDMVELHRRAGQRQKELRKMQTQKQLLRVLKDKPSSIKPGMLATMPQRSWK